MNNYNTNDWLASNDPLIQSAFTKKLVAVENGYAFRLNDDPDPHCVSANFTTPDQVEHSMFDLYSDRTEPERGRYISLQLTNLGEVSLCETHEKFLENMRECIELDKTSSNGKFLKEDRQQQYVLLDWAPFKRTSPTVNDYLSGHRLPETDIWLNDFDDPYETTCGISLFNAEHVFAILANYSKLVEDTYGHFDSDLYYIMIEFDRVSSEALASLPIYEAIVTYKIDGLNAQQIIEAIEHTFDKRLTPQRISQLWRHIIPQLIADYAAKDYVEWYYTFKEKGKYKKCGRCGRNLLANHWNFTYNKSGTYNLYSICRECRSKKEK